MGARLLIRLPLTGGWSTQIGTDMQMLSRTMDFPSQSTPVLAALNCHLLGISFKDNSTHLGPG